ncbi:dynein axonemal assembly factor 3 isoform X1 [Alligator mississippiensis]|uniref:dynein axonemal assembly factor 3 isoform X1 n=1 Tax=Alligator mississippiensis TaxID=8496 RepID=UPI00090703F9|nr:dynein axonemal assembly factor 3 isoform X1 [Alligator mississippiensis]XP_019344380.1 dynein axonemal assembly factor 3 isoform X1 [Alligator mississippiensis]XP_019344381.1 dynein axonemal assembly factor 3 isoform X1 [Alligator mississippiensis]
MTAAGTGTGFGTTTWWGFSPALDLQKECLEASLDHVCQSEEGLSELNILLVGSVDGRHVLKTMCQAHRWPQRKINFYIVENNPEVLARQLLFLSLALEPQEKMGLQEKSETFLELLGNSLMRSPTATYLQEKSDIFIRLATDPDFQQCYLPVLDMAGLKFKERDQLEGIFRFWLHPDPQAFPIVRLWDLRVRQYLGTRYDTRNGVSDWDLNMKLHEQGASVINIREYTRWRDTGVAFELREGIYDTPNKTLASGRLLRLNGDRVPARGYWGDIATGPYILFGIETEEQSLLKTINGVPSKSAQEISLHNVTAMFHELAARARYIPPGPDPKGDSVATPVPGDASQPQEQSQLVHGPISPGDVQIHFLPLNSTPQLHCKNQYQRLFNLLYFSCSMIHDLTPELQLVSAPSATLIVELTTKHLWGEPMAPGTGFLPDLHKDQANAFTSRATALAAGAGFQPHGVPSGQHPAWMCFQLQEGA